jgi:hypothetical protein
MSPLSMYTAPPNVVAVLPTKQADPLLNVTGMMRPAIICFFVFVVFLFLFVFDPY